MESNSFWGLIAMTRRSPVCRTRTCERHGKIEHVSTREPRNKSISRNQDRDVRVWSWHLSTEHARGHFAARGQLPARGPPKFDPTDEAGGVTDEVGNLNLYFLQKHRVSERAKTESATPATNLAGTTLATLPAWAKSLAEAPRGSPRPANPQPPRKTQYAPTTCDQALPTGPSSLAETARPKTRGKNATAPTPPLPFRENTCAAPAPYPRASERPRPTCATQTTNWHRKSVSAKRDMKTHATRSTFSAGDKALRFVEDSPGACTLEGWERLVALPRPFLSLAPQSKLNPWNFHQLLPRGLALLEAGLGCVDVPHLPLLRIVQEPIGQFAQWAAAVAILVLDALPRQSAFPMGRLVPAGRFEPPSEHVE